MQRCAVRSRCLTALVVLAFALAPMGDLLAFGLHEHVVDRGDAPDFLHAGHARDAEADHGSSAPHHCELSASAAVGIGAVTVSGPLPLVGTVVDRSAGQRRAAPFIPLTPPRA